MAEVGVKLIVPNPDVLPREIPGPDAGQITFSTQARPKLVLPELVKLTLTPTAWAAGLIEGVALIDVAVMCQISVRVSEPFALLALIEEFTVPEPVMRPDTIPVPVFKESPAGNPDAENPVGLADAVME